MKRHSFQRLFNRAFTMMELIFVLVVIGILAAVIIPNTRTNPLQEAAIQLISHIRYTQHLALVDDRYNPDRRDDDGNVIWFKDRWQLVFSESEYSDDKYAYTIFSDTQGTAVARGDANEAEIARNPQNSGQIMTGGYGDAQAINYTHQNFKGMKKLNIGSSYGVSNVTLSGGCADNRISFDYMGRPFTGDQSSMDGPYDAPTQRLITENCLLTLTDGAENIYITITPETGYSCISDVNSNCI